MTSHYRQFVKGFAKIAQPLHNLTKKGASFYRTAACEAAFDYLKSCLITAPVLAYPDFNRNFVLETFAGLGAILSQIQEDGKLHPLAYASRSLSKSEKNYSAIDLETLAVVWGVTHFRYYLYGHQVTIYTDHTAVKAVLGTPNLTGKHACWWSKIHGCGIGDREVNIMHRAGRGNQHADALSRQPVMPAPTEDQKSYQEVQIARVATTKIPDKLDELLGQPPTSVSANTDDLTSHQLADPNLQPIILYLKDGGQQAQEMISLAKQFTILDEILYRESPKRGELPQIVVPASLRRRLIRGTSRTLLWPKII